MTEKTVNYSPEMTAELVEAYKANPTDETVKAFAEKFNKSVKSIVAKLSREKVYVAKEYKTKTGEKPVAKADLVAKIAKAVGSTDEAFDSLEKANKAVLEAIAKALTE